MNISEECFKEIIEMVEALIEEADHHANKKNPVVKITDKNYRVALGKSLPGPFNKNHVGQYIVYNKDTDASYLVTPDNWKKSKIKKDLESQGKFYEALEILENIYDEINKKFMNGKISADKAIKLEKKFQDKMSPEKVSNDRKEIEAQYKGSLEPTIQYVKNLKALRRNDKKNNGKSNLKYTFDYRPEALKEAFEETMKLLELFDRPDLLDDIDTLLGSPVKKTFKKMISDAAAPKKEVKVKKKIKK